MGILLSRATIANWVIRCAQDCLMPIIDSLRRQLLSIDILHVGETPIQVLREEGRKPQSKSYMWLYRTGKDGKAPIILFDYQPSRSGEHAVAYLKDFKCYVHSDGYSGYNKLKEITLCGCRAYLRRKFVEVIPLGKATGGELSEVEIGRTISWTEDYPCQTMLPKMPSGHSWRGVKTGCLQILQKEQPHQLQSAT